ncbi:hypothetical protein SD37_20545 [Amycolatopsis orientalis]|uniref:Peptidase S8 n=1 Tax=Amycolatopsis orientalis TaxID=31958 RepID=A0A193C006_AMYOR|nr:hypothetical protein SD37_20545 [Amycolatopsis orientalis]
MAAAGYQLTLRMIDRNGAVATASSRATFDVIGLSDGGRVRDVPAGTTLRLPADRYALVGSLITPRPGLDPSMAAMAHPELNLTRDTTVTLDTRQTAKVTANVDQPEVTGGSSLVEMGVRVGADRTQSVVFPFEQRFQEMFAGTLPGTSSTAFYFGASHRLEQPRLELFGEQPKRFPVPVAAVGAPLPVGSWTPALAFGGAGRQEDLAGVEVRDRLVVLELPSDTTLETLAERVATVHEHGGAMVAAWLRPADAVRQGTELSGQPGSRIAAAATAGKPSGQLTGSKAAEALVLPTLQIGGANAERFAASARAGGSTATVSARQEIRDAYELSFPATGRVPAQLEHSVRKSELAAVTMAFHGYSAESPPQMHAIHRVAGVRLGMSRLGYGTPGLVRAERQEYYTPGTWAFLNALVSQTPSVGGDLRGEELFAAGKSYRLAWNGAVTGPGFRGKRDYPADKPWAGRATQEIDISIPLFSDGAGHTGTADLDAPGDRGSTALYREGRLFGSQATPGRAVFVAPSEEAGYRLTTEAERDEPWAPLSTKVSAEWTFRSGYVQGPSRALPLLEVRYTPAVDLANSAPGGGSFTVPVTVSRQDGPAAITGLQVEASYDGGITWRAAKVSGQGGRYNAELHHPATGSVSLRAKAADADGNTTIQSITHAYRLR